jgi:tetratricopeptide (TPR) repeat protein
MLIIAVILTLPMRAQQKPFTQEQVQGLVRDGLGDESGAKLVERRGIDFAPAEDFMQSLKAAGASEAFLKALRTAKHPEPASAKKPLNQVQVFALLVGQVPSHRVTMLVQERGIDFRPTDDYVQEVRLAGGDDELISALKSAKVVKPATVDPAAEARQFEVRQHMAHGAQFYLAKHYADAEAEFRAALRLDPENADLHVGLGATLGNEGDWGGEIAEEREALRLNPDNELAHLDLGEALGKSGDLEGEIAAYREASRLDPNSEDAHFFLGRALSRKGDWDGAIAQYCEVLRLNPEDENAHVRLGWALAMKGDLDRAITEYREALRLNPNNDTAHVLLGSAHAHKGDWDGAIAEEREALRVNPSNPNAHYSLGVALEQKGDRRGALQEYRSAYMLDPKNATYKQDYERLLQQVNR